MGLYAYMIKILISFFSKEFKYMISMLFGNKKTDKRFLNTFLKLLFMSFILFIIFNSQESYAASWCGHCNKAVWWDMLYPPEYIPWGRKTEYGHTVSSSQCSECGTYGGQGLEKHTFSNDVCTICGYRRAPTGPTPTPGPLQTLELMINETKSHDIPSGSLSGTIKSSVVADPTICSVVSTSTSNILVKGLATGSTTITITSQKTSFPQTTGSASSTTQKYTFQVVVSGELPTVTLSVGETKSHTIEAGHVYVNNIEDVTVGDTSICSFSDLVIGMDGAGSINVTGHSVGSTTIKITSRSGSNVKIYTLNVVVEPVLPVLELFVNETGFHDIPDNSLYDIISDSSLSDPSICDVVSTTSSRITLTGLSAGSTIVTITSQSNEGPLPTTSGSPTQTPAPTATGTPSTTGSPSQPVITKVYKLKVIVKNIGNVAEVGGGHLIAKQYYPVKNDSLSVKKVLIKLRGPGNSGSNVASNVLNIEDIITPYTLRIYLLDTYTVSGSSSEEISSLAFIDYNIGGLTSINTSSPPINQGVIAHVSGRFSDNPSGSSLLPSWGWKNYSTKRTSFEDIKLLSTNIDTLVAGGWRTYYLYKYDADNVIQSSGRPKEGNYGTNLTPSEVSSYVSVSTTFLDSLSDQNETSTGPFVLKSQGNSATDRKWYIIGPGDYSHEETEPIDVTGFPYGKCEIIEAPVNESMLLEFNIPGNSSGTQLKLPIQGLAYGTDSYIVNWGDGTIESFPITQSFPTHTYSNTSEQSYTVIIGGSIGSFGYTDSSTVPTSSSDYYSFCRYLKKIISFGDLRSQSLWFCTLYQFGRCDWRFVNFI